MKQLLSWWNDFRQPCLVGNFSSHTNVSLTLFPPHGMLFSGHTEFSLRDLYGRPHTTSRDMEKCNCHSCYWPIFL
jgi:hypothetical protein